MTTYRFWPSTNGGSLVSYTGAFQSGIAFVVTQPGMWFEGFWWWCPTGGDTASQQFALWSGGAIGSPAPVLIPGTTVMSGTLTPNTWNYVPLSAPVPLSIGVMNSSHSGGVFIAVTGWTAAKGFPDTNHQFGSGDIYGSGLSNGPLLTSGAATNTPNWPGGGAVFGTAHSDATSGCPTATDSTFDNFWMDVQVSDTAPAGYTGTYRIWPNRGTANSDTGGDAAVDYVIDTEFHLTADSTVSEIWYFSPTGTAQLATWAGVYSISGPDSGTQVVSVTSPTWNNPPWLPSGAGTAATGWLRCTTGSVTLSTGQYKVAVHNNAGTPDQWSAKDASSDYWQAGEGANGIVSGPISAPQLSSASSAYLYDASAPGASPPYSNGTVPHGQPTFAMSGPQYPYLWAPVGPATNQTQNYWIDVVVTPVPAPATTYTVNLITGGYTYTPLWT